MGVSGGVVGILSADVRVETKYTNRLRGQYLFVAGFS